MRMHSKCNSRYPHACKYTQEKDAGATPIPPNTLTWIAWLLRVVDKDIRERGRRVLRERLEESFMPEEVRIHHPHVVCIGFLTYEFLLFGSESVLY
jgi:hypothetical protein